MFSIDSLQLESPFILAPLAGYTDLAFRLLCREYGASLCYSEMISCHGLVYDQGKTIDMTKTIAAEKPVAMQLFGNDPDIMGAAAAILSEKDIDLIDINMGCPVKKVIKKGAGAALLKDPQRAERIIRKVNENSSVPTTVKIRTGWNHHTIIAPDFAKMAEQAGASAVTLHARTWTDGFSGTIDPQIIIDTKNAVSIPVIGNGDILSFEEGERMLRETGCDGVMIGRGALGRPWVFQPNRDDPSLNFRLKALRRHLKLIQEFHAEQSVLARMKNHAGKYLKGLHSSAAYRQRIYDTQSFEELCNYIESLG